MAQILNVSRQSISNFVAEGMPRHSRGRYDLLECFRWHKHREHERQEKMLEGLPLREQEIRFKRAQASIAELKLAALKRELVAQSFVDATWHAMVHDARREFRKVPARVAQSAVSAASMGEVTEAIRTEIHLAMDRLARLNAKQLTE